MWNIVMSFMSRQASTKNQNLALTRWRVLSFFCIVINILRMGQEGILPSENAEYHLLSCFYPGRPGWLYFILWTLGFLILRMNISVDIYRCILMGKCKTILINANIFCILDKITNAFNLDELKMFCQQPQFSM